MAEEIDNVFENDQMYIRKPTDTNRCVCKERIVCKSRAFSNRSTKIGVCASSLSRPVSTLGNYGNPISSTSAVNDA
ncbi:hypothetical protein AVEN_141104-1, partial [Araneus ventricosus]